MENQPSYDPRARTLSHRLGVKWRVFLRGNRMFWHTAFWRTLFFLGLGWPFSRLLCRLGLYKQYQAGVCGFCGNKNH